jgi:hypothetical protein
VVAMIFKIKLVTGENENIGVSCKHEFTDEKNENHIAQHDNTKDTSNYQLQPWFKKINYQLKPFFH